MPLIDCPYYGEDHFDKRWATNCWDTNGWDEDQCYNRCLVPGVNRPLCYSRRDENGWHGKKFICKVNKADLEKALSDYNLAESLKPESLLRRIEELEAKFK